MTNLKKKHLVVAGGEERVIVNGQSRDDHKRARALAGEMAGRRLHVYVLPVVAGVEGRPIAYYYNGQQDEIPA